MLDIISGLLTPTQGRVLFDGVDVTRRSTVERNIAQVFQFPVLYDSMTVEQNMRFPLRNRGIDKRTAQRRAEEIAELLDISHLLPERARGLPADAKQLVSLSRALVRRDVSAILFDEPLTVIDPHKKWGLRQALKRVHAELSHTLVYVTHDQTEALTFADVVVVMNEGEIMQKASPDELFERPAHRFVGNFIGSPGMNFLPCTVHHGVASLAGVDLLRLPETAQPTDETDSAEPTDETAATDDVLGVRPDFIRLASSPTPRTIAADITAVRDLGTSILVGLTIEGLTTEGLPLVARLPTGAQIPSGQCWVAFEPGKVHLFRNERRLPGCVAVPDDERTSA
jgi:glycerol transport system ATP-binding protein